MGMFDYLHVHKSFLPKVKQLEENNYSLESLQTKDFDSLLETYHVDEIGTLSLDKVDYIIIENTEPPQRGKWNPPFFQEEKSRSKINIPYTGVVTAGAFFMDYKDTKDEIFIDINFNFIDGVLQEKGKVVDLRITPADEVLERRRQIEERRIRRDNDLRYNVFNYIQRIIHRLIYKLHRIQDYLRSYEPK